MGENRIMLNIGGIANFTYLPGDGDMSRVVVTDTGPGNTLMDTYMKEHFYDHFDRDGNAAARGKVHFNS
ncbi:MAG: anhydro-N-acetylmuramic acid kinase [Saprospiraceae bacterium]